MMFAIHARSPASLRLGGRIATAFGLAFALFAPGSARAQVPDVVAFNALGPPQTILGKTIAVNVLMINLGGPLSGDISFEVILTEDTAIDAGDLVIGAQTEAVVGAFTVPATIPDTLTPGSYNLALRVLPVAGEINLDNNEVIGSKLEVTDVNLCIANPADIVSVGTVDGPAPPAHVVQVLNCGSSAGILIFTVVENVSWLTATPSTSFTVAGGAPQPVMLSFDSTGLTAGQYATQVLFQNFQDSTDFEILNVTLNIEDVTIHSGDLILGEIDKANDFDEALFPAVEGMTFKVQVSSQTGNVRPVVSILTESGDLVKSWTFQHSTKKITKTTKLAETGFYRLRIEGEGDTLGDYIVQTRLKLPPAAKKVSKTVSPSSGKVTAAMVVLGLPDGILQFTIKPKKNFTGPLVVTLRSPDGTVLDVSANTQTLPNGTLEVQGVPFVDVGAYEIEISGFGSDAEKVKFTADPTKPGAGATVLLP